MTTGSNRHEHKLINDSIKKEFYFYLFDGYYLYNIIQFTADTVKIST